MTRTDPLPPFRVELDPREARMAVRIASLLDEASRNLDASARERLRFAREQALGRVRRPAERVVATGPAALLARSGIDAWLGRVAAYLPLLLLVAGLFLIESQHRQAQIATAAEIDAALLSDDAPLAAYRDAGFVEFLKMPPEL